MSSIKFISCHMRHLTVAFTRDNIHFRAKHLYMERFHHYYHISSFILMIHSLINVLYKGKFNIFLDKCVND